MRFKRSNTTHAPLAAATAAFSTYLIGLRISFWLLDSGFGLRLLGFGLLQLVLGVRFWESLAELCLSFT
jgi:hypothetical protein